MSYKVNRSAGYQRWGVTNPWVFANYGQPQRRRGYVSPVVFQTQSPTLKSAYLGAVDPVLQAHIDEEKRRADRMERYAMVGVAISAVSAFMIWHRTYGKKALTANRRRRRKRR